MTANHDIVAEAPFGRGALVVEQATLRPGSAFVDGKAGRHQSRRLVYRYGESQTRLHRLRDIHTLAVDEQVDVCELVSQLPYDFALLFSTYVGLGSVVTATTRFAYLHPYYGIDLQQHVPRVCESELHFMVLRADLDSGTGSLHDVWWRLSDMSYRMSLVAVLDRTESGNAVSSHSRPH